MGVRLALFLFSVTLLSAQRGRLQEHLNATPEQWAELNTNASAYYQSQLEVSDRLSSINTQVSTETIKPVPNPAELGAQYLQIENLCRSLIAPRVELHNKQLQVLTAEQRALLAGFDVALANQETVFRIQGQVDSLLLKPLATRALRSPANGTLFDPPSYLLDPHSSRDPRVQDELIQYLSLTGAQRQSIESLHAEYRQLYVATFERMRTISVLVEAEIGRQAPNGESVRRLYSQIDDQRRILAERGLALRRDLSGLLTESQRARIEELDRTVEVLAIATEAQALSLLPPADDTRPSSLAMPPSNAIQLRLTSGIPIPGSQTARSIFRGCKGGPEFYFGSGFSDFSAQRQLRQ